MNSSSHSTSAPLLDKPRIIGSSAKVRSIFKRFVEGIPGEIDQMKQAIEACDSEKLIRLAHKFQGTAGSCGFSALMEEAIYLQEAVRIDPSNRMLEIKLERLELLAKLSTTEFEQLLPQEH